jgi:hypothetical protein
MDQATFVDGVEIDILGGRETPSSKRGLGRRLADDRVMNVQFLQRWMDFAMFRPNLFARMVGISVKQM